MRLPDIVSRGEYATFYKMFHVEHFAHKVSSCLVAYLLEAGSTYTVFACLGIVRPVLPKP